MDGKALRKLLEEVKEKLGLKDKVYLRVKPLKRSIAIISLKTKRITINKNILNIFTKDEIKYILAHELLHLKYGKTHTLEMDRELENLFGKDVKPSILKKIKSLIQSS
ncbi:MAG: M56 family metallopeptidase [candidate division WOR-3 bacterium]